MAPELNAPPSATIACPAESLFVHVTVDPTEILIGFGANPPAVIVALTVVGVGDIDELLPHADAAVNKSTAQVILIPTDMMAPSDGETRKRTARSP